MVKIGRFSWTVFKVLRPSGPNYWKNGEWIPYGFCKEYCSECQTNLVMGQKFGTITFCHLLKLIFLIFPMGHNVKVFGDSNSKDNGNI